jgi:uncharacterized protein YcaQ
MQTISLFTARQLSLYAQRLLIPPQKVAQKSDVKQTITALGALQIDTINIVARAPYFSLWSRLGDYDADWLNQLLAEQSLFEFWAHAACFLPIEDYGLHRRIQIEQWRLPWYQHWYADHKVEFDAVLSHVRENGSAKSSDFKRTDGKKGGTWWDWKIEKRALEYWFTAGELMISKRVNFQRVYDLRERVLPDWKDSDAPDLQFVYRSLVLKSIAAMGLALPGWIADYFRLPKKQVQTTLKQLIEKKLLLELKVEDWDESAWTLPEVWEVFKAELKQNPEPQFTTILSPFDSLIWDRARTRKLFNFDFSIECYLPAAKRKYGYFLLPVLNNGQIIARMDAKSHRADRKFEVKSLYLEPHILPDHSLAQNLVSAITNCARWHRTPLVSIDDCNRPEFLEMLKQKIQVGAQD